MAPAKKRLKTGQGTGKTATSMGNVTQVQLKLRDWVEHLHGLRHEGSLAAEEAPASGQPAVKGWPTLTPGTFRSVAKQVWGDAGLLLQRSLDLVRKAGLLPPTADLGDLDKLCLCLDACS